MISYLFPPRCAVCGKVLPHGAARELCPECDMETPRITGPRCEICGTPMGSEFAMPRCYNCAQGRPFVKCFVPFVYDGPVRRLIIGMKFYDRPEKYRLLAREIAGEMGGFRPDFITWVPQNSRAYRERGYSQTRLIASELGKLLGVPVKPALRRLRGGKTQVGLSRTERKLNARRVFAPGKTRLSGTWLLVDDVATTGSTLDVCCRFLKGMGCEQVYAAVAAIRSNKNF